MIDQLFAEISVLAAQFTPGNISENSIFIGFLGAALVGSAGWYGRVLIKAGYAWLRRKLFDEVVLYSDDEVLSYLETYISSTRDLSKRRNVIAVMRGGSDGDEVYPSVWSGRDGSFLGGNNDSGKKRVKYILGEGNHFMLLKRTFCWMNKTIETDKVGNKRTIVRLRIFGSSGKATLNDCISDQIAKEEGSDLLKIYNWSTHGGFYHPVVVSKRSLSSLIVPNNVIPELYKDLDDFSRKKSWYSDRGIPYKRGYLLYGPPGTGKTSLIKALSSSFTNKVFCINLSVVDNDSSLDSFFSEVGHRDTNSINFVVIEDIDCVLREQNREGEAKAARQGVTLNGLLNALDGLSSVENLVTFMTTNYVDALDPALIRPGRADVKYYIDKLGVDDILDYLRMFFEDTAYSIELPIGLTITGAELQGICLKSKGISEAIEELKKVV